MEKLSIIYYLYIYKPVCLDICSRKASPLEIYENLKSRTIREEIVPLPDPGGPIIKARKNFAIYN